MNVRHLWSNFFENIKLWKFSIEGRHFRKFCNIREVKYTNVYVNVYVCLGICAYYVIMTSSVLNAAKIYKLQGWKLTFSGTSLAD